MLALEIIEVHILRLETLMERISDPSLLPGIRLQLGLLYALRSEIEITYFGEEQIHI